jgi:hypothetical protein
MKKTAFITLLFLCATSAFAQHGQNGYTGFSLISPAQISVGTDSNFLVDRTTPDQKLLVLSMPASILPGAPDIRPLKLDDRVFLLKAPTIGFLSDSRKRELSVTYQPEFEIFQKNSDQNSWNSTAGIDFNYQISRRWQMYAGDSYRSSKDPSRTLQNVLLLLPRSQYRENAFRGSLSYAHSARTAYTVRYDHTVSTFGINDPLQRRQLDMLSSGISANVSHMLSRTQRIRVTYSTFSASPWNRQKTADDRVDTSFTEFKHPAHSVGAEYRFALNPRTILEVSGGGIHTHSGMNYVWGVFADRRIGEVWLGGGYSRSLSLLAGRGDLPSALAASSFYELINFHLRGQPLRKVGVESSITGSRGIYGALIGQNKTLMSRNRVDYRLNDRTVAFLTGESYLQNRNDYVAEPLSRHRIFFGVEYSLASESARRTSRLIRDADNVALTEHGRLRTKAH